MQGHHPRLSIIVVALNEEKHILCLKQSMDELHNPDHVAIESILVDGGSSDGTLEQARQAGFSGVLESRGESIPTCRNRGLAAAQGDWIAFVDADCELEKDWLVTAVRFLAQAPDPLVIGWPARPPAPSTWVQKAWLIHWTHKNMREESFLGEKVVRHEGFRLVTTRNMVLHRSVAERLNGFDEALKTGEDTDFVFRAYLQNIPVLGVPALAVIHHGEPATARQFFLQQLWHANRQSYARIAANSGGRIGGHAPLFTGLFLLTLLAAALGFAGMALGYLSAGLLLFPLILLVAGPAVVVGYRAKKLAWSVPLMALYFLYGLARVIDVVGGSRAKTSWKAKT